MDRGKNENELAEERNDPELEEELAKVRGEGANPEKEASKES